MNTGRLLRREKPAILWLGQGGLRVLGVLSSVLAAAASHDARAPGTRQMRLLPDGAGQGLVPAAALRGQRPLLSGQVAGVCVGWGGCCAAQ